MTNKQRIFIFISTLLVVGIIDNFYIGFTNKIHPQKTRNNTTLQKYYSSIKNNSDYIRLFGDSSSTKYALIYLDDDDVPELLVSDDDLHASQVSIFVYDVEDNQVKYVNAIGSNASVLYLERENKLYAEYGNQGMFTEVLYSIHNNNLTYNDGITVNNNTGVYYSGIVPSEMLENESLDYYTLSDFELIEVSSSEYKKQFDAKSFAKRVSYEDMKEF